MNPPPIKLQINVSHPSAPRQHEEHEVGAQHAAPSSETFVPVAVRSNFLAAPVFFYLILLKKSFSENQKKIFRTQMLYIARSELG
jgi:hypothetical protein